MSLIDDVMGCRETPLWLPTPFAYTDIPACPSCVVRLTAKLGGPGHVTARIEGLQVEENTLVTLSINGIQHSLLESVLSFPGGHRLLDRQSPCDAELFLFFRSTRNISNIACLAIPIDIGADTKSNPYFSTLESAVTAARPSVAALIPTGASLISYKGADVRGRHGGDPYPRTFCDPIKQELTYYVCNKATRMAVGDYNRLMKLSGAQRKGPPKPMTAADPARVRQLASYIADFRVEGAAIGGLKDNRGAAPVTTKSLKCYRLNPDEDVQPDGTVYVGGKPGGGDTLESELKAPSEDELAALEAEKASVKPGDIAQWLGIVIGIIVGLVICATIAFYALKGVFSNYLNVQKLYNIPVSASSLSMKMPELPKLCPTPK